MTKAEIVSEVAKATGIEKVTVQTVFEAAMESIKESIVKGESGSSSSRERKRSVSASPRWWMSRKVSFTTPRTSLRGWKSP
ncbi:MAG: HU family DNA-binding protein, partial [Bacteroidales bacterium]|nr:HU family DNA-binding protein [Bacteroidales bacterium]